MLGDLGEYVLALAAQLEQGVEIRGQLLDFPVLLESAFQALPLLEGLLAGCLVVPEIRRRDLLFNLF
jgi:hypothetical protein